MQKTPQNQSYNKCVYPDPYIMKRATSGPMYVSSSLNDNWVKWADQQAHIYTYYLSFISSACAATKPDSHSISRGKRKIMVFIIMIVAMMLMVFMNCRSSAE